MIDRLPPRERQLFETLYSLKEATATALQNAMVEPASNSAVRVMLRRLETKGYVSRREEHGRFVYRPTAPEHRIKQSALRRFADIYFGGSPIGAAAALIGMSDNADPEELRKLEQLIEKMRQDEKQ